MTLCQFRCRFHHSSHCIHDGGGDARPATRSSHIRRALVLAVHGTGVGLVPLHVGELRCRIRASPLRGWVMWTSHELHKVMYQAHKLKWFKDLLHTVVLRNSNKRWILSLLKLTSKWMRMLYYINVLIWLSLRIYIKRKVELNMEKKVNNKKPRITSSNQGSKRILFYDCSDKLGNQESLVQNKDPRGSLRTSTSGKFGAT
jgi:hypothetical protein